MKTMNLLRMCCCCFKNESTQKSIILNSKKVENNVNVIKEDIYADHFVVGGRWSFSR
jgi:hypothetical protein